MTEQGDIKMNENQIGPNNLLDTTDCLEAVGVFKGWKNFFFVIIIVCLLLTQISFWLVNLGWVTVSTGANITTTGEEVIIRMPITAELKQNMAQDANEAVEETAVEPNQPVEANEPEEATEANLPAMTEKPAVPNEPVTTAQSTESNTPEMATKAPTEMPAQAESAEKEQPEEKITETVAPVPNLSSGEEETSGFLFGITFDHLVWTIRFANALLILAATLYCLTMLFSLKVSMLGRLGGINHITRAFFLSLLALVLLLPWQKVFSPVIVGAIFTPEEMAKWFSNRTPDLFDSIIYYLRFCGFWLLIVLLLILAQIRSSRWAGAILRRLEII